MISILQRTIAPTARKHDSDTIPYRDNRRLRVPLHSKAGSYYKAALLLCTANDKNFPLHEPVSPNHQGNTHPSSTINPSLATSYISPMSNVREGSPPIACFVLHAIMVACTRTRLAVKRLADVNISAVSRPARRRSTRSSRARWCVRSAA